MAVFMYEVVTILKLFYLQMIKLSFRHYTIYVEETVIERVVFLNYSIAVLY